MSTRSEIRTFEDLQDSSHKVALVLGTSRWTNQGAPNLFFKGRIQAAQELYDQGIVKHLLLSGDNGLKEYNEPLQLKKALEERGVPSSNMTMDFAGFRTLDSIVRSRKVFGQDSVVIITQSFHLPRALFIAKHADIHAVGYIADGPTYLKLTVREILARTIAVVDIIFGTEPKFLGKEEHLEVD